LAEDELHLLRIFDCITKWSKENHIEINYKKSRILIINDNGLNRSTIGGYPVVESYKYLGIDIDSKMKPNNHLRKLNTKLNEYFKRNFMLHKKYFSAFSLIRLIEYFVRSRLSYGMCCFLDQKATMGRIHTTIIKHIKAIFGLPKNTSHERLQLVLGIPELKYRLAVFLLKNWHKYKDHFGVYPEYYH
jgi:hypothetical protein